MDAGATGRCYGLGRSLGRGMLAGGARDWVEGEHVWVGLGVVEGAWELGVVWCVWHVVGVVSVVGRWLGESRYTKSVSVSVGDLVRSCAERKEGTAWLWPVRREKTA